MFLVESSPVCEEIHRKSPSSLARFRIFRFSVLSKTLAVTPVWSGCLFIKRVFHSARPAHLPTATGVLPG